MPRPGHYVAECPISAAHMDVTVPSAAHQYPYPMYYGGGWVQQSLHGSGGYTSAVATSPQPSSNNPHDRTNDGSCVPTFYPHILIAQFAQKDKSGRTVFLEEMGENSG